jgi:Response regulator containing CheY-like receiver, AAA-type ATPase, and DNA-binding domains
MRPGDSRDVVFRALPNRVAAKFQPTEEVPAVRSATPLPRADKSWVPPIVKHYYTVGTKDAWLMAVARAMYDDGSRWPKIWLANLDQVTDPRLIHAGQRPRVPEKAPLTGEELAAKDAYMKRRKPCTGVERSATLRSTSLGFANVRPRSLALTAVRSMRVDERTCGQRPRPVTRAMKVLTPQVEVVTGGRAARVSGEVVHPHLIPEYSGNETILLVDDKPMFRDLLTFALERYGYTVLVAVDGEDAIQLADSYKAPIHLVLSEVVMPKLDGCTLCSALRRWYPSIGVLLMSENPDGELAALNLKDDLTFFIRKPFGADELAAAVRVALDWRPRPSREVLMSEFSLPPIQPTQGEH